MPHLQFDLSFTPSPEQKTRFASAIVEHFARVMDTGSDHIAVSLRCGARGDLTFGRAEDPTFTVKSMTIISAPDQKRLFALAAIEELERTLGVPRAAVYVIFTEHDGPDFQMHDGVLPSWSAGENPLENLR